jgi:MFS family permease
MFLFDALWNAGIDVSANGYMLKFAPRENRAMYVATITGVAGLCGGLGAIAGGTFLHMSSGMAWHLFGRQWTNYHLFFLIGALLRLLAALLVRFVREPSSDQHEIVVTDVIGDWQMSFSRVPIGLFRLVSRAAGMRAPRG